MRERKRVMSERELGEREQRLKEKIREGRGGENTEKVPTKRELSM